MGHPDWQSYPNWRGAPFVDETTVFPSGLTTRGPFAVTNYQSLLIDIQQGADQVSVVAQMYTDPTLTVPVDSYSLPLSQGVLARAVIPLFGNGLQIAISNTSGGNKQVQLTVAAVNIPVAKPVFFGNSNEINEANVAVPAGQNVFFPLPYIQPGLAHLWLNPRDATGKLNFLVRSGSQTTLGPPIFVNNGPTTFDQRLIALADRAYLLEVSNTDGAVAHNFDASLIPVA